MGKFVFVFLMMSCVSHAAAMIVEDPAALVKLKETIAQGKEALTTAREISETATKSLDQIKNSVSEIQTLNSVLGSPISGNIMSKLSGFKGSASRYGSLLGAVSSRGDLASVENFSRRTFGTPDCSKYISAKDYLERKYFKSSKDYVPITEAKKIRRNREKAARDVVINSLAVSETSKSNLAEDHEEMLELSKKATSSSDINHQIMVQTQMLKRIAETLDKLVLLQSQQLEFMAKTYLGDRGVVLEKSLEQTPSDKEGNDK